MSGHSITRSENIEASEVMHRPLALAGHAAANPPTATPPASSNAPGRRLPHFRGHSPFFLPHPAMPGMPGFTPVNANAQGAPSYARLAISAAHAAGLANLNLYLSDNA
jgi:hypothetical protein